MNMLRGLGSGIQYLTDGVESGAGSVSNGTRAAHRTINGYIDRGEQAAGSTLAPAAGVLGFAGKVATGVPLGVVDALATDVGGLAHLAGHPIESYEATSSALGNAAQSGYTSAAHAGSVISGTLSNAWHSVAG